MQRIYGRILAFCEQDFFDSLFDLFIQRVLAIPERDQLAQARVPVKNAQLDRALRKTLPEQSKKPLIAVTEKPLDPEGEFGQGKIKKRCIGLFGFGVGDVIGDSVQCDRIEKDQQDDVLAAVFELRAVQRVIPAAVGLEPAADGLMIRNAIGQLFNVIDQLRLGEHIAFVESSQDRVDLIERHTAQVHVGHIFDHFDCVHANHRGAMKPMAASFTTVQLIPLAMPAVQRKYL